MAARRSSPVLLQWRRHTSAGRRALVAATGLVLTLALISLGGCKDLPLQKEGQTCGGAFGACAKGLRCSFKKKKCYRPVDCAHLDRKLKACLSEVVSIYAPQAAKIPVQKRTRLLERIGQQLQTEVVDHCKYDAAAYRKKHSTTPTKTKSYGEDSRAKKIAACLHKQECRPFAQCLLDLARVVGPKRPTPKNPPVFPIAPPRPAAATGSDAGVSPHGMDAAKTGMDAAKTGMDAKKTGMDAKKTGMDAKKTGMDAKPTKSGMPAKPTKSGILAKPTKSGMPAGPVMRPMTARPAPRPR